MASAEALLHRGIHMANSQGDNGGAQKKLPVDKEESSNEDTRTPEGDTSSTHVS